MAGQKPKEGRKILNSSITTWYKLSMCNLWVNKSKDTFLELLTEQKIMLDENPFQYIKLTVKL